MRKIALRVKKGGVGKTTFSVNMAYYFSQMLQKRVLVIDADPQHNLTTCFNIPQHAINGTLADILMGKSLQQAVHEVHNNLWVLPANSALANINRYLDEHKPELTLSRNMEEVKSYDYIIFDCMPGTGKLIDNVLCYCEEVWAPLQTNFLSFEGINQVFGEVNTLNKYFGNDGVNIRISAIIPNLVNKQTNLTKHIIATCKEKYQQLLAPIVCDRTAVEQAPGFGKSIFEYASQFSEPVQEFKAVGDFLHG